MFKYCFKKIDYRNNFSISFESILYFVKDIDEFHPILPSGHIGLQVNHPKTIFLVMQYIGKVILVQLVKLFLVHKLVEMVLD